MVHGKGNRAPTTRKTRSVHPCRGLVLRHRTVDRSVVLGRVVGADLAALGVWASIDYLTRGTKVVSPTGRNGDVIPRRRR